VINWVSRSLDLRGTLSLSGPQDLRISFFICANGVMIGDLIDLEDVLGFGFDAEN
jgi:hypothetical protein